MLECLLEEEKEVMLLLIQGHNFQGINQFCNIDYKTYKKIKRSIYLKLKVKGGMNALIGNLLQKGVLPQEL